MLFEPKLEFADGTEGVDSYVQLAILKSVILVTAFLIVNLPSGHVML